jgi:hypothetical protein
LGLKSGFLSETFTVMRKKYNLLPCTTYRGPSPCTLERIWVQAFHRASALCTP